MSTCCRTCDHRNHALNSWPSAPSQLDVCIVALKFGTPITSTLTDSYIALNTLLNNIVDNEESAANPSTFTVWSPCLSDPSTVVILTTVQEVCDTVKSPIFCSVEKYLTRTPSVQHTYLDLAVVSLAASSPEQRVPCDVVQLHVPSPAVAVVLGLFTWDPKPSSLSSQLQNRAPVGFSWPGDLIRDFWAWSEFPYKSLGSSSVSTGSWETLPSTPPLVSTNSDENNMSLPIPEEHNNDPPPYTDDETLIMIFQWSSHAAGDRFKDQNQKSYGPNGEEVGRNLWDKHVAHPVKNLQRFGARAEMYRVELRAVELRLNCNARKRRSGSKRLSLIASGLGEKVSGLWR